MNWHERQIETENLIDYQSYKITQALKGKMAPTLEQVIYQLKVQRKVYGYEKETLQDKEG